VTPWSSCTADHECSGAALIGGSRVTDTRLQELVREGGVANIRDKVVGIYEQAGFPKYKLSGRRLPRNHRHRLQVAGGLRRQL